MIKEPLPMIILNGNCPELQQLGGRFATAAESSHNQGKNMPLVVWVIR
jgi:hypothetical protein